MSVSRRSCRADFFKQLCEARILASYCYGTQAEKRAKNKAVLSKSSLISPLVFREKTPPTPVYGAGGVFAWQPYFEFPKGAVLSKDLQKGEDQGGGQDGEKKGDRKSQKLSAGSGTR